jgi:hypothetical protein
VEWRNWTLQKANPIPFPRLLRLGGERRGEEAASHGADECPPIHYSIT